MIMSIKWHIPLIQNFFVAVHDPTYATLPPNLRACDPNIASSAGVKSFARLLTDIKIRKQ